MGAQLEPAATVRKSGNGLGWMWDTRRHMLVTLVSPLGDPYLHLQLPMSPILIDSSTDFGSIGAS